MGLLPFGPLCAPPPRTPFVISMVFSQIKSLPFSFTSSSLLITIVLLNPLPHHVTALPTSTIPRLLHTLLSTATPLPLVTSPCFRPDLDEEMKFTVVFGLPLAKSSHNPLAAMVVVLGSRNP